MCTYIYIYIYTYIYTVYTYEERDEYKFTNENKNELNQKRHSTVLKHFSTPGAKLKTIKLNYI